MRKITINNKQYVLRFDMAAMEYMEEHAGKLAQIFGGMQNGDVSVKSVRVLLEAMAISGADETNGEKVSPDAFKHLTMRQVGEARKAIQLAMSDGMKTETDDQTEDCEDAFLKEIEAEKN